MLVGCTLTYLLAPTGLHLVHDSDNAHGRVLPFSFPGSNTNTVETCINGCIGKGYQIAGMEYSSGFYLGIFSEDWTDFFVSGECYCGNTLINGAVKSPESDCNMACSGSTS
jgi:hypothetical protein